MKRTIPFFFYVLLALVIPASGCISDEARAVRELEIESVDLIPVNDGTYRGDFTFGNLHTWLKFMSPIIK